MEGYLAVGTGSSQPTGLVTASTNSNITIGGTTANPAITFDNLIQLMNSIDPAYLQQDGCGFVAHQQVISLLQQIKTTTGEYIWREAGPAMSSQAGRPLGVIYGYPVYMNNSMPTVGTQGNVLVAFGQLKKLHVRKVNQVEFFTNPYLFSLNGQIVLQAWMRFDSNIVDAGTHPIKYFTNP
jgi:HK97 family phage major capsid protein